MPEIIKDPDLDIVRVFGLKEGVECWAALTSSSADMRFRHNTASTGGTLIAAPTTGMLVSTYSPDSLSSLFEVGLIPKTIAGADGVYGLHYKGGKFPDANTSVSVRVDALSPASYDGTALHANDAGLLSIINSSLSAYIGFHAIPTIKVASVTPGVIQSSANTIKITFNFDRPIPTSVGAYLTANATGFPSGFTGTWEVDSAGRYTGYSMTGVWQDAPGTNTHTSTVSLDVRSSTISWLEGFTSVSKTNERLFYYSGNLTIQATPDTVPPTYNGYSIYATTAANGGVEGIQYTGDNRVTVRALQVVGDLTIDAIYGDVGSGVDKIQLYNSNSSSPSDTWVYLADLVDVGAGPSGLPNTRTYRTSFRLGKSLSRNPGLYLKAYDKVGNNASTTCTNIINANLEAFTIDSHNQPSDTEAFVVYGTVKYITRGNLADFQYVGILTIDAQSNPMALTWISHDNTTGISTCKLSVNMGILRRMGYVTYGTKTFTIGITNKYGQAATQSIVLDYQPNIIDDSGRGGIEDPWIRKDPRDNDIRTMDREVI